MQKQGWKKIRLLSELKLQNPSPQNVNFFWIRGEFYIEKRPEFYKGIYLGYIHGRDVIYINNKLIGIKNVDRIPDVHTPSQYVIPSGILVKGKNSVSIRLEISSQRNRGVSPNVFIQPKADYEQAKLWNSIWYKHITGFTFILICLLFIVVIIQVIIDRKEKIRVLSLLFLLINIIMAIPYMVTLKDINVVFLNVLLLSGIYVFIIFFIFFLQALYGFFLSKENKFFIPLIGLFAVIYNLIGNYFYLNIIHNMITFVTLIISFSIAGYVLCKLQRVKPDWLKFIFLSFVIIIFAANIICEIMAEATNILYWPVQSGTYLFPAYLLLFVIYGAFEAKKRRKQLDGLYKKLKNKQHVKIKITSSSEEKLARVIEFIKENYTEDISREGLAAAIDINPNYLSSIFNAFTGKKIQEYINLLRVKNAAMLIESTKKKIIDIAFAVGFINLSTFIRAFKKEMGKTPKEYRSTYITTLQKSVKSTLTQQ